MRVYLYRWTIYEYNRVYGTRRGRARLSVRISVDRHKAACTLIALHAPPIDTIPLHADSEAQRGCAPLFARDYRAQREGNRDDFESSRIFLSVAAATVVAALFFAFVIALFLFFKRGLVQQFAILFRKEEVAGILIFFWDNRYYNGIE